MVVKKNLCLSFSLSLFEERSALWLISGSAAPLCDRQLRVRRDREWKWSVSKGNSVFGDYLHADYPIGSLRNFCIPMRVSPRRSLSLRGASGEWLAARAALRSSLLSPIRYIFSFIFQYFKNSFLVLFCPSHENEVLCGKVQVRRRCS